MLQNYRVIFVGERGRETTEEYKELIRRGAATYECCAVQGGRRTLHSVLAKGQEKGKSLVLIADQPAMIAAVGEEEWAEMIEEAAECVHLYSDIRPFAEFIQVRLTIHTSNKTR